MGWYVAALPVKPGMEAKAKQHADELKKHMGRYEELNAQSGLKRHMEFVQETPMGATVITIFEADDPSKLGRPFSKDEYDTWWVGRIKEIHGFDLSAGFTPPKTTQTIDWKAPGVK